MTKERREPVVAFVVRKARDKHHTALSAGAAAGAAVAVREPVSTAPTIMRAIPAGVTPSAAAAAGTASTAGTVKSILMGNGDELIWGYDDALQGAGGSSNLDVVIISMPEVTKPKGKAQNTNEFANLSPGNAVCSTQYCDMPAPREILSPLAGGATDFLTEWRVSSGWAVRGQGLSLITMSYA